jgi:hypothetical protein
LHSIANSIPFFLQTSITSDTVNFEFTTEKLIDSLENFDIRGRLIPHEKGYHLTLAENLLVMLGFKMEYSHKKQHNLWYQLPQF